MLDGVYRSGADGVPEFIEVAAPTEGGLHGLLQTVIARLMKLLTRRGVLFEDDGQSYLAESDTDAEEARTLRPLQAGAVTYRIAFGPRAGRKVLPLRGAMPREAAAHLRLCADIDGFSLHAAVRVEAHDRKRLERLCRYIMRPALSDERIQVNAAGQVERGLKTPWQDGTTRLVLSPLEFMQRLAALVPRPRLHLIRYHGVLAPNATLRARVVPQGPAAAPGTGERGGPRVRRRLRSARDPWRVPWAGAQAPQSRWRLRAVSGIRPEHGVVARIATRGRSQPGCVHARVRPRGRLRVVLPPALGACFLLPGLGRAFEIPIRRADPRGRGCRGSGGSDRRPRAWPGPGAMSRRVGVVVLLACIVLAGGCTSREVYQSSQGARRAQCDRILEADRRAACYQSADRDFDSYQRDREAATRR